MSLHPFASLGLESQEAWEGGVQLSLWDSTTAASIRALVSLLINCVQLGMLQKLSELEETSEIN